MTDAQLKEEYQHFLGTDEEWTAKKLKEAGFPKDKPCVKCGVVVSLLVDGLCGACSEEEVI